MTRTLCTRITRDCAAAVCAGTFPPPSRLGKRFRLGDRHRGRRFHRPLVFLRLYLFVGNNVDSRMSISNRAFLYVAARITYQDSVCHRHINSSLIGHREEVAQVFRFCLFHPSMSSMVSTAAENITFLAGTGLLRPHLIHFRWYPIRSTRISAISRYFS